MVSGQEAQAQFWSSLELRARAEWLIVTPFILTLTLALCWFAQPLGIARIDNTFYDRLVGYTHNEPPNKEIVIVAIDDSSIEALGYWPWRRATHAHLLRKLDQARVVALDILMSDRNTAYPNDDELLAAAMKAHGRVVLPTMLSSDGDTLTRPYGSLADAAAALGYVNIYPDRDGIVRAITLNQVSTNGQTHRHFLLAALKAARQKPPDPQVFGHRKQLLIPYRSSQGHYTVYPYDSVLNGEVPASVFADKYVIVGAWATGLGDLFPTPAQPAGDLMPGVEILANGLQSILENHWVHTPDPWLYMLLACLPVLLACLSFRSLSPRRGFVAALSIVILVFTGCVALLWLFDVWVPVMATFVGIAVALPLWSWRSQEVSLQQIGRELNALERERFSLDGSGPEGHTSNYQHLSLPSHISQLHDAIEQLRRAYRHRENTVRFLSHDMRSPQNSILALTQLQQHADTALEQKEFLQRVATYANETLRLVDGFVHLARAEAVALILNPVDLATLTEETADEFWASARQRNISIDTQAMPAAAWLQGDAALLRRVWGNLFSNAIKFSPPNTVIRCRIDRQGIYWRIRFTDQGTGIPPSLQPSLFQPFARATSHAPESPAGTGLGLAFVHTVIQRHAGQISAANTEGGGAEFTILLPASE
ncbi:CHASE2 domain-containing protein [Pusillimonas sp. TS35]|uniref:CHASE2 domain-containing protein n=1 Tax=Paracandidimonas lactea TaxID=2895524 RepID=UPI00136A7AD9|nr:CHASE2 domain-containing protein [Paracandidimonas lactea]MYN12632.1 CHASE2 domain-containing protein [Pusillimonas sp. TS35]